MALGASTSTSDERSHLTDELAAFRDRVREFVATSQATGVACPDFGTIMPPAYFESARSWQRHCFDAGFAGIDWPAEFGGQGLSPAHAQVWGDECARTGVASRMNFQGIVLAGPAIAKFGTDEQKARYLEATLRADIVWCQLFSEPDAGSDLASLATRADTVAPDSTSDGWEVTGQKVWSSTAQLAQHAILLARTDPDISGSRGISFFLLEMDSPGIEVRPIKQMTGDHEFCEVFLDNTPLPPASLLGPLHGGWQVATSVLADERAGAGAAGIALERRLAELGEAKLVDPVEVDRLMQLHGDGGALARLLARASGDPLLGPLTKLGLTELSAGLTTFAVDAHGPRGMLAGDDVDSFLYAPGMRVAGGTSEIQRNLIGERLLGLPREPKAR